MIEFLVKLGVLVTITLAIIAVVLSIPAFGGLVTYILADYGNANAVADGLLGGINALAEIMRQYVTPFMALVNNVIPANMKYALTALLVWKMVKPLAFRVLAPLEQALEKLITKA